LVLDPSRFLRCRCRCRFCRCSRCRCRFCFRRRFVRSEDSSALLRLLDPQQLVGTISSSADCRALGRQALTHLLLANVRKQLCAVGE
jgi:hypothetical protein